jgi:hypothetical protein
MKLKRLGTAWQTFFFTPQSPLPLACFRILYGLCMLGTLLLLRWNWFEWFGVHGWFSQTVIAVIEPEPRLNIFLYLPQNDWWVSAFFWIFLGATLSLIVGFWTRCCSIIVYVCFVSLYQRNPFIWTGGDTFLRAAGFFLMFAPAAAALSVDRLIDRARRHRIEPPMIIPWAQRMIQIELVIVYLMAFCSKLGGATWRNGTALYYVLHYRALTRFSLPHWAMSPTAIRLETWSVLAFELCFPLLVWLPKSRGLMLFVGLMFHLSVEYALNIPMFEWSILSSYVLFVDPQDIKRFAAHFRSLKSTVVGGVDS